MTTKQQLVGTLRVIARWVLAFAFVKIGIDHFVDPDTYLAIVPAYLPWHLGLVYVSGVAEIAGGLGALVPRVRRLAGWGLLALLVAVFPANVEDVRRHHEAGGWDGATVARLVRLPMQVLFGLWVWWCCLAPAVADDRSSAA